MRTYVFVHELGDTRSVATFLDQQPEIEDRVTVLPGCFLIASSLSPAELADVVRSRTSGAAPFAFIGFSYSGFAGLLPQGAGGLIQNFGQRHGTSSGNNQG